MKEGKQNIRRIGAAKRTNRLDACVRGYEELLKQQRVHPGQYTRPGSHNQGKR